MVRTAASLIIKFIGHSRDLTLDEVVFFPSGRLGGYFASYAGSWPTPGRKKTWGTTDRSLMIFVRFLIQYRITGQSVLFGGKGSEAQTLYGAFDKRVRWTTTIFRDGDTPDPEPLPSQKFIFRRFVKYSNPKGGYEVAVNTASLSREDIRFWINGNDITHHRRLTALLDKPGKLNSFNRKSYRGNLASSLSNDLGKLGINDDLRMAVEAVLTDPEFPTRMFRDGRLEKNPIWKRTSQKRLSQIRTVNAVSGTSPPTVMHLDVFLIKTDDRHGGKLYTYHSERDWRTYFFPFRLRNSPESDSIRKDRNAKYIAPFLSLPEEALDIRPIPQRYLISAKQHPVTGDLFLYIFEFCSLECTAPDQLIRDAFNDVQPSGNKKAGRWFCLEDLLDDRWAKLRNGDVLHFLHMKFEKTLSQLPTSFSGKLLDMKG